MFNMVKTVSQVSDVAHILEILIHVFRLIFIKAFSMCDKHRVLLHHILYITFSATDTYMWGVHENLGIRSTVQQLDSPTFS